jgi:hypothetical protein
MVSTPKPSGSYEHGGALQCSTGVGARLFSREIRHSIVIIGLHVKDSMVEPGEVGFASQYPGKQPAPCNQGGRLDQLMTILPAIKGRSNL